MEPACSLSGVRLKAF